MLLILKRFPWSSFGPFSGSEISMRQGGVQRYLWVLEGARDIFEFLRGSEISFGVSENHHSPW